MTIRKMTRVLLFILFLVLFGQGHVLADVFRCRTSDGTMMFTSDPTQMPEGCQPLSVEESASKGGFSTVPAPTTSISQPAYNRTGRETPRTRKSIQELKDQALQLASDYRQAVKQRARAGRSKSRRLARQNIAEVKQRRDAFLSEVSEANISWNNRQKIREILAVIP